ncbi:hypothetical protein [Methanobrevibacter sp.]|uniref:hypothetical protein n=1 Tax=Methanobrevibacter sp. TaxID=66852 RepID=UPI0038683448
MKNIDIYIRVDTPYLIKQVFDNPGTSQLKIPFNTVLKFLGAVAQRASELNDPKLNMLMIKLNLYEVEPKEASSLIDQCIKEMK